MLERVKNILFPAVCPICGKILTEKQMICDKCKEEVSIIKEPRCIKCGKPLETDERLRCTDCSKKQHFFERGVSVFEYTGDFKESMYRFKYSNAREYADFYACVADKMYHKLMRQWNIDVIIPVPMYNKKKKKRGYNQAEVFGKVLSKYMDIPILTDILIRSKDTIPQKELNDEQRRENLFNAFAINPEGMSSYRNVLLVDDIYTTGSTIDACARLLLATGVQKVYFLCISSGK